MWVVVFLLAGMSLACGIISVWRAAKVDYDFSHFYVDSRYLWKHGELNTRDDLDDASGGRTCGGICPWSTSFSCRSQRCCPYPPVLPGL